MIMFILLTWLKPCLAVEHLRAGQPSRMLLTLALRLVSNLQIVETARKVTGHPIRWKQAAPRGSDTLIASSEKARKVLGWREI